MRFLRGTRGQLLVELAVALPLILLVLIGGMEAGFLIVTKAHQDRATSVVAEYAATHDDDSWHAVAERELDGCDVTLDRPHPDLVEISATCRYQPHAFPGWSGLPISSRESAAESPSASPSPSPSATGSFSSTTARNRLDA